MALLFALVVAWVGRPVNEFETTRVIGYVEKDSPAEKAGLQVGDEILEVDGRPVTKWGGMGDSVHWRIVRSEGKTIPIKIKRKTAQGEEILTVEAVPRHEPTKLWQRKSLREIQILPAYTPIVAGVVTNSPALRAGLKRGDEIVSVDGHKLYNPANFADYIEQHDANADSSREQAHRVACSETISHCKRLSRRKSLLTRPIPSRGSASNGMAAADA